MTAGVKKDAEILRAGVGCSQGRDCRLGEESRQVVEKDGVAE
jgi:hypothetical protein